ncbi:unnamed protein product, partial [marine sediment metagenome]
MNVKRIISIAVAVLVLTCIAPMYANAQPALPHAFYGALEVNGSDAAPGYTVEARGEGVTIGIAGNPIETTEVGRYGSVDPLGAKLAVQGDISAGTTLTFYVNGKSTGQTAKWCSGGITELDLTVTIPTGGGGGGVTRYYMDTSLFGVEERYRTSLSGELQE